MGLFGDKKTKLPEKLGDREPMAGTIQKTYSEMLGVPRNQQDIDDIDKIIERVKSNDEMKVLAKSTGEKTCVVVKYKEEEYNVEFYVTTFDTPELFTINHLLDEESIKILQENRRGLCLRMTFGTTNIVSYHLQLKLLNIMVPDLVAVADFSCVKIYSGVWAKLAAQSEVPPSPLYLYTVQAVSGKKDKVWLHTHGLNRCGGVELEIVDSNKQNCNDHYNIIMALAGRIADKNEFINESEPMYIAQVSRDIDLVATWVDWNRVMPNMDKKELGGLQDRDDGIHNGKTGIVYLYASEEDYNNEIYSPVSIYDKELADNPLIMYTNEETQRMKALAAERLYVLKDCVKNRGAEALIKVGLEPDEEYKIEYELDEGFDEHIWFELIELKENTFIAKLTQEPYYVNNLKAGDIREISYDDITDWTMLAEGQRVTPDTVYLVL